MDKPLMTSLQENFDGFFQKHAELYPIGISYLRYVYSREMKTAFDTINLRWQQQAQRPHEFWMNLEDITSDILAVTGMSMDQLFQASWASLKEEGNDFDTIKRNLYEHPLYPATEHLHYIDFPPALQRGHFLLKHLPHFPEDSVRCLDLGCGPGVLLALLLQAKPGWTADAVDISQSCIRYAQKLLERKGVAVRASLQVADVRQLPYGDAEFDVVIAVEVLEHIPDPETGLAEIARVLRPSGHALVALPVDLPIPMHLSVFSSVSEVQALYQQVGLELLDFEQQQFQAGQREFTDTFALLTKPNERSPDV